jgi:mRNA-degrading endonuclease YafQ of YafQ-DinJ toxin-antitoxin module
VLGLLAWPGAATAQRPAPANPHVRLDGRACTDCHTTSDWRAVRFDHDQASFRLLGQHRAVPCAGCHDLRDFRGAASACGTCHSDPHRGDAGSRCEQCHSEVGWHQVGAQNAHARTRLPDLGVHAALRCEDCHRQTGAQQFTSRVTACVACHQSVYNATTSPSHSALGLSVQCETCHQFTTWSFARFTQHDAIFPIHTGAHAGAWRTCATCHPNATTFTVFVCTTCHTQPRTDPRHQGISGYQWQSQACLTCHPTGRAEGFAQHDAVFPINSGTHQGKWTACSDCHTDPANRQVYSCMTGACHPQAATDPAHSAIPGYQYVAAQCFSCHPDGRAGTFAQHDAVFPINSGTHQGKWTACSDCHTDPANRQVFSCMTGACHAQAATTGLHQGIPGYQYTGAQCLSCHPTGLKGTFTQHDPLFFPIYSGTHAGRWNDCVACHTDANTRATFTCMSGNCHPSANTASNHQGVNGYQYVASACYSCHPQGRSGGVAPFRVPTTPRRPPGFTLLPAAPTGPLTPVVRAYVVRWEGDTATAGR